MNSSSTINKPAESEASDFIEEKPAASSSVELFKLQEDKELENTKSYDLADLLKYHDRAFVTNVYSAITKEPPSTTDMAQRLHELRSGTRTKTEIVEDLVKMHPNVRVDGLSSPAIRAVSRWPVIGYVLRVLRSLGRLPVMIQHQQQFESYIAGQHQQTVDYVNEVLTPSGPIDSASGHDVLAANVSDAVKTVMMLSDSLIGLSANLADEETRLQSFKEHQERVEADFRTSLSALIEQLSNSNASIQQLQKQQEQSEAQLHANLVTLTNQLSLQQEVLAELRREQESTAASQREFLIDEQRVIVEAQRAALTDLQDQLDRIYTVNKVDKTV